MEFKHPPVFQCQVSQDAEHVFSKSIDTVDVLKKQPIQNDHPSGTSTRFLYLRSVY